MNWDTDGGNNCGPCYAAVTDLAEQADVVGGLVLGCGSWVDQHCATRLAEILGGPCLLSASWPAEAAQDAVFRRDLSTWAL